ncbi:histidine kinase [Paenibacillus yonginensis]|uniref:histidine kinase n=2 Tax=Paenibacillus yonginensis TaxID=1462996 RepID=A0A1B1N6W7_9BACL|nr:histidine kinase [Paenibacillus yonginensis]
MRNNRIIRGIERSWLWRRLKLDYWPLRYQLGLLFLAIGILPSLCLSVLVNWTAGRIVEQQVAGQTQQLIGKVNQTLDNDMENLQNITYLIGFDNKVQAFLEGRTAADGHAGADPRGGAAKGGGKPDLSGEMRDGEALTAGTEGTAEVPNNEDQTLYDLKKYLQNFTTLYPEIAGILVVNAKGDYISNELYAKKTQSLTEDAWYKAAAAKEGIFTILGQPSGRNLASHVLYRDNEVITVVRSLADPKTKRVTGVVLIDLKLWAVSKAARDVKLGKTGYLMVTERSGKNIYLPDAPYLSELPASWFGASDTGTFTRTVGGQRMQFIFASSAFTGWRTVGVFLTRESAAEVRQIHFYVICFMFLVGLFGLTASLLLSQSISRPIRQLRSFMSVAEEGDLTVRYRGGRRDEIGLLGRSFNRMLTRIQRLMELNETKERQKREAELRSLQAHIKPHFLYNTLDTIHWMAKRKGAEDVSGMVESLSKLFRIGLSKGGDIIPVTEELEHIRSYLQIQQTRYKGRLEVTILVNPETEEFPVLKLLLQPVVENAIYHGIKARRGPGSVDIHIFKEKDVLILRVADNGAGMPPPRLAELRKKLKEPLEAMERLAGSAERAGQSYGLLNVQARLRLAFGEQAGIELESAEGEGTRVTIRHPLLAQLPSTGPHQRKQEGEVG